MNTSAQAPQVALHNANNQDSKQFQDLLVRSMNEDLIDIQLTNAVQFYTPSSNTSHPLVTIIPANLPSTLSHTKLLLLILHHLESYLNPTTTTTPSQPPSPPPSSSSTTPPSKPYQLIYIQSRSSPSLSFLKFFLTTYTILPTRYKTNLITFSIIHPTLWTRLFFLTTQPILGINFWNKKLHYCDGIDELWLDGVVEKEALQQVLPRFVWEEQKERDLMRTVQIEQRMGEQG